MNWCTHTRVPFPPPPPHPHWQINQEPCLFVAGGNVTARNETHKLFSDLGEWSVEFSVLTKLEQRLAAALDERRIVALTRNLQALDIFKSGSVSVDVFVKLLGQSQRLYLATTEVKALLVYYSHTMNELLVRRERAPPTVVSDAEEGEDVLDRDAKPAQAKQAQAPGDAAADAEQEVAILPLADLLQRIAARQLEQQQQQQQQQRQRQRQQAEWSPQKWKCVQPWKLPKGRRWHSTTAVGEQGRYLVTFGGENFHGSSRHACSGECLVFDLVRSAWTAAAVKRPAIRRFGHAALWWDDYAQCENGGGLLVFGGVGPSSMYTNALQVLGVPKFHADPPRPDPEDGRTMLFREDFIAKYGGTSEWKARCRRRGCRGRRRRLCFRCCWRHRRRRRRQSRRRQHRCRRRIVVISVATVLSSSGLPCHPHSATAPGLYLSGAPCNHATMRHCCRRKRPIRLRCETQKQPSNSEESDWRRSWSCVFTRSKRPQRRGSSG